MDTLQEYEIEPIVQNLEYYERPEWERTRFLALCNIQSNSTKRISPQDILQFPWENDNTEEISTNSEPLTQDEIKRLKEQARIISQTLETDGE